MNAVVTRSQDKFSPRARALLVIPPLLKVVNGPLLGPAMLVGAGRRAGHVVTLLDLNAQWLDAGRLRAAHDEQVQGAFLGDHDRPAWVRDLEDSYHRDVAAAVGLSATQVQQMTLQHEAVLQAARALAASEFAEPWPRLLRAQAQPQVVGISVMYAGQVLSALALSRLVRERWPHAMIVWGGAHVTALAEEIAAHAIYGELVDRFVFGYAEATWVELLDAVASGREPPPEVCRAGQRRWLRAKEDGTVVPAFDDLARYAGRRLTLPAQVSRGCSYGKCTFCTYPAIEAQARALPVAPALEAVQLAAAHGGVVSFKDSFLTVALLDELAERIAGRVRWSACTRFSSELDDARLQKLAAAGCATLELGLETLTRAGQRVARKAQSGPLVQAVLRAAAQAGIALVINYMMGFPGVERQEEERTLADLQRELNELRELPGLRSHLELNDLQVERGSAMGRAPAEHGVRVIERWPWSTVMAWEPAPVAQTLIPLRARGGSGKLPR